VLPSLWPAPLGPEMAGAVAPEMAAAFCRGSAEPGPGSCARFARHAVRCPFRSMSVPFDVRSFDVRSFDVRSFDVRSVPC
jgi:hypothetical protein